MFRGDESRRRRGQGRGYPVDIPWRRRTLQNRTRRSSFHLGRRRYGQPEAPRQLKQGGSDHSATPWSPPSENRRVGSLRFIARSPPSEGAFLSIPDTPRHGLFTRSPENEASPRLLELAPLSRRGPPNHVRNSDSGMPASKRHSPGTCRDQLNLSLSVLGKSRSIGSSQRLHHATVMRGSM